MIAVFSDLHGNLDALQKALPEMQAAQAILCLGDTVGYRRHPEQAVRLVRNCTDVTLQGNHDAAATGHFDDFLEMIPPWLQITLRDVDDLPQDLWEWLASRRPVEIWQGITLVHGSLRDPLMEFLVPGDVAREHLRRQTTRLSLVGHTHQPLAVSEEEVFQPSPRDNVLSLGERRWVLNPGSLGIKKYSPCWMTLDKEQAVWHFV